MGCISTVLCRIFPSRRAPSIFESAGKGARSFAVGRHHSRQCSDAANAVGSARGFSLGGGRMGQLSYPALPCMPLLLWLGTASGLSCQLRYWYCFLSQIDRISTPRDVLSRFIAKLRSALNAIGMDPLLYAGHSFQKGAATAASQAVIVSSGGAPTPAGT